MRFVFVAEPRLDSLDRTIRGWQIVHYVGDDRLVGEERFRTEVAAKAWAGTLNAMAEPDPAWWAFDMLPWDFLYPQIPLSDSI
jgi:hypothetical protein